MNKFNLIIGIIASIALILGIITFTSRDACDVTEMGGHTEGYFDSAQGYRVDGTEIVTGSGGFTITSSTLSGTLDVTGDTELASTTAASTTVRRLISGGNVVTITTASTSLTAAQMCNAGILRYNLLDTEEATGDVNANDTLYFATSGDLIADCVPEPGDHHSFLFDLSGTSTIVTLAVPPGGEQEDHDIDLLEATADGDVVIQRKELTIIDFWNQDGTTTTVAVTNLQAAD